MLTDGEWMGLGVAATLLGAYVADKMGWIQIRLMQEAHALQIKKATPRIGSRADLVPFHPANRPDVTGYTIDTNIYNDGDLVARQLEGQWKLTASHGITEATIPIRADSLPSFLSFPLKHEVSGKVPSIWCEPSVKLQVDIDLVYLGLDDKQETYHAIYDYDYPNRKLVQRK
jgi:hypothetical protein